MPPRTSPDTHRKCASGPTPDMTEPAADADARTLRARPLECNVPEEDVNGRDNRPFHIIMEEIYIRADIRIYDPIDQQRMVDILREAKAAVIRGEKYQVSRARLALSIVTWACVGGLGFVLHLIPSAYRWLVDHTGAQ